MPRRNLSVLSSGEDPYTLNRFPQAFAVTIGKQTYNARQLAKAAKVKGQWLDMYRQPIPAAKVREILALTRQRPRAETGRFMPTSGLAKFRKLAARELRARREFNGFEARGVFYGFDDDQRDGAMGGIRLRYLFFRAKYPQWGREEYLEYVPDLVSRMPWTQNLPPHAQDVARRFAAMDERAVLALLSAPTHVPPPRRSARPRHR